LDYQPVENVGCQQTDVAERRKPPGFSGANAGSPDGLRRSATFSTGCYVPPRSYQPPALEDYAAEGIQPEDLPVRQRER
jgi:hypothetical protein